MLKKWALSLGNFSLFGEQNCRWVCVCVWLRVKSSESDGYQMDLIIVWAALLMWACQQVTCQCLRGCVCGCMFFLCGWVSQVKVSPHKRTGQEDNLLAAGSCTNERPCSPPMQQLISSIPAPFYHVASPDVNRQGLRKLSYCKSALWPGKHTMKAHRPRGLFTAPDLEPMSFWLCAGASVVRSLTKWFSHGLSPVGVYPTDTGKTSYPNMS